MSITSYLALLSHARERESSSPPRTLLEETESDRARLVFSSPFRRLQQKAQVYSLEDNAAVRSRLTHSLEVAHIGRFLSQLVIKRLNLISTNFGLSGNEAAFQNLVETACLMHDIGNPPFGHFGEAAISEWFRRNAVDLAREASHGMGAEIDSARPKFADFEEFDGNCQGLRIISRLQWNRDEFGLNLSFSQLATYLKYVTSASGLDGSSQFKKKPGYFSSEAELVQRIWKKLGMQPHTRFPLTYLMEAADDIAYCISDIEDGIEKGLITEPDFFHWINNRWKKNTIEEQPATNKSIARIFLLELLPSWVMACR